METKKKTSVWKDFIAFVRTVKLPYVLIAASFLLNLGKAVLELLIPGKMAAVTGIDLSGGDASVTKTAVALCLTVFAMALTDFVIGGSTVYGELLPWCEKAHITRLYKSFPADRYFPDLDAHPAWRLLEAGEPQVWEDIEYSFRTYGRV